MTNGSSNGKSRGRVRLSNGKSMDGKGNVRDSLKNAEYEYVYGDGARRLYERLDPNEAERSIYDRADTNSDVTHPGTKKFLQGVDNRTLRARKLKSTYDLIIQDLGGIDNITVAQSELARKAATMAVLSQEMESAMVVDDADNWDFDQYIILARAQSSLFRTLGIDRKQKDVGSDTLDSYVGRQQRYQDSRSR